jgi:hypothetical protein
MGADAIWGMLVAIQFNLKVKRLQFTKPQFYLLFCMVVK